MGVDKNHTSDGMINANTTFLEGAKSVLYFDGKNWTNEKFINFNYRDYDYMRSLANENDIIMFAIDIDAGAGLSEDILKCAKDLFRYFGSCGVLKASGIKGIHVIPFKVRFPATLEDRGRLVALRDIAYTAYVECQIWDKYGFPFIKRSSKTSRISIQRGYIDLSMYERGHKIRGFCRRYVQGIRYLAWSVPIGANDDLKSVKGKINLRIEPNWDVSIPTLDFSEKMIGCHYSPPEVERVMPKRAHSPFSNQHQIVELNRSDDLGTVMKKLYDAMPPEVKRIWNSDDPSHREKFGIVCWLNMVLKNICRDDDKRAALITELWIEFVPLKAYRESGRFSRYKTEYHIRHIVLNDYSPPKWVWN